MKKLLLTLIMIFVFCISAFGKNAPLYKTSISNFGIGVIKLPQEFKVYEAKDEKSSVLADFKWGSAEGVYIRDDYSDNFIIFDSLQNMAFMTVVEDSDDIGWYKVCYDQKKGLTGWVHPSKYNFYSWLFFYIKYGKANGLYALKDLDNAPQKLYSKPDFESQVINTFEKAKDIRVHIFRGNWVLVRIYDYEGGVKIGWLNWRTPEGKLNYFPNVLK